VAEVCRVCPECGKPVMLGDKYPGALVYHMACAVAVVPKVNDDQKGR